MDKPHIEEIKAFYECVTRDRPSPVPWTETIRVIAVLEAIYRSEVTGKEVSIRL